ncbi:MAG TPA: group III truncated hemoglobin [Flavipsychrobacter sp.]|nr:group III truncated hemoglobin [Flavipsychrobacter sp.]
MEAVKNDVADEKDVQLLVDTFYGKVRKDAIIGHIFDSIIGENWSHHMPVMYRFWEMVLLGKTGYAGNPVRKHIEVDRKIALAEEHYDRWLQLWNTTVNSLFAGTRAEEAKKRAAIMMQLISVKIQAARDNRSIL